MTSTATTTTTTGSNPPSLNLVPHSGPPGQNIPLDTHPQLIDLSNLILSDATPSSAPTSAVARRLLSEAVQILSLAGRSLHLVNVAIDANVQMDSLATGGVRAGGEGAEILVEKDTNATKILSQITNGIINNRKLEQGSLVNEGADVPPEVQNATTERKRGRERENKSRVVDDHVDDDDSNDSEEEGEAERIDEKLKSFWKGNIRGPEDTYEGIAGGSTDTTASTPGGSVCHRKNCQAEKGPKNEIQFGTAAPNEDLDSNTESKLSTNSESTLVNSWSNILLWERETLLSLLDDFNVDPPYSKSSLGSSSSSSSSSPFSFLSPQSGKHKTFGSPELDAQQLQYKLELLQTELVERERKLVIDLVQVDNVRKILMEEMDGLAEKQRELDIREGDILEKEIMGMEESLIEATLPAESTGKKPIVEDYCSDDEGRLLNQSNKGESVTPNQHEPIPPNQKKKGNHSYRERRLSIEENRVRRLETRVMEHEKRIKDREEALKDQEERMKDREAAITEFISTVLIQRTGIAEEMTILDTDTNVVEEGLLARYEKARKDNAWSTIFPQKEKASKQTDLDQREIAVIKREENLDIRQVTLAYEQQKAISFKQRLKQRERRIAEMERNLLHKIRIVKQKDSNIQSREKAAEIREKDQNNDRKVESEISTSIANISSSDPSTLEQREKLLLAREQALDKADRWIQEQQIALTKTKANIMSQEHRAREITEGFYQMEDTLDSREQHIHLREKSFQWREKMHRKYGRPWPERKELEEKEMEARLEKRLRIELEAQIREKIMLEGCKCNCTESNFDGLDARLTLGTGSMGAKTTTCTCCGMKKRALTQYDSTDTLANFFRDLMNKKNGPSGLLG